MRWLAVTVVVSVVLFGCTTAPEEQIPERVEAPEEQAPAIDPLEEAYESISLAVTLGNPEDAIAAYEAAELEDPGAPETRVLLANLYLAAGDTASAEDVLARVLDEDPENVDALFSTALIAGARGDEDRRESILEQILELDPTHTGAQAAYGEIQLENRHYQAAREAFTASLEQEEDNLVALVGIGNVLLRLPEPEPEEAEAYLTQAIDIAPEYPFSYVDRSRALAMQHRLDEAESDLDRAIDLDGEYIWHRYDRGNMRLEQRDMEGAIEDFTWVIERDPDIFLNYVYRARAYDFEQNREAAAADYRHALQLRPDYEPAYGPLAVLLFELGEFDDAAQYFDQAWGVSDPAMPADPAYALLSSLSLKHAGRETESREYIEDAAASFPRPSIYWELARYYISPSYEGRIIQEITNEEERILQIRGKFFLAAHMELLGRTRSAVNLYREVVDENLYGYVVARLAEWRYALLTEETQE